MTDGAPMMDCKLARTIMILLCIFCALPAFSQDETWYEDEANDFRVKLPSGWHSIDKGIIDEVLNSVSRTEEVVPDFVAGFSRYPNAKPPFATPYIFIQVVPYSKFGYQRTVDSVTIDQFESAFSKALEGKDWKRWADENLTIDLQSFSANSVIYDEKARKYIFQMDGTYGTSTAISGYACGFFSSRALVQVLVYYTPGQFNDVSIDASVMFNSLRSNDLLNKADLEAHFDELMRDRQIHLNASPGEDEQESEDYIQWLGFSLGGDEYNSGLVVITFSSAVIAVLCIFLLVRVANKRKADYLTFKESKLPKAYVALCITFLIISLLALLSGLSGLSMFGYF